AARGHGAGRRDRLRAGAGAHVRDADLRVFPPLHDGRPRDLLHGVLALRGSARPPRGQGRRRREGREREGTLTAASSPTSSAPSAAAATRPAASSPCARPAARCWPSATTCPGSPPLSARTISSAVPPGCTDSAS